MNFGFLKLQPIWSFAVWQQSTKLPQTEAFTVIFWSSAISYVGSVKLIKMIRVLTSGLLLVNGTKQSIAKEESTCNLFWCCRYWGCKGLPGQMHATFQCKILHHCCGKGVAHVGSSLKMVKFLLHHFLILHDVVCVWPAPSHHLTTWSNNVARYVLHWNVACVWLSL